MNTLPQMRTLPPLVEEFKDCCLTYNPRIKEYASI